MRHAILVAIFLTASLTTNADTWDGKDYNANSASQQHAADRLMDKQCLGQAASLLDVGCGDGKITARIADRVEGKVVGLDLSKNMIDFAQRSFAEKTHLEFVVGDAAKLDYVNEFDYVTSFSAMQWVRDQKEALIGMHRALKPGGRLLITMPKHYPECLSNALLDITSRKPYNDHFKGFSAGQIFFGVDEYRMLLAEAGFDNIIVAAVDGHDRFANVEAFSNFVKQWLPWAQFFSDAAEKDLFMKTVMERYVAYCPTADDGSVMFFKQQLEATATKAVQD